jgi:SAM-dependent methyltransferase
MNNIKKINNIIKPELCDKIIEYIMSKDNIDLEPFSNSPYRSSINIKELNMIDKDIVYILNNIIKENLGKEFDIYKITVHYKDKWLGAEEQWHQDYQYNLITHNGKPENFYRLFIALDEHTNNNGCMIFMNGSHNEGELDFNNILSIHSYQKKRTKSEILDKCYKKYGLQLYPLKRGEGILFNSLVLHSSSSNQSNLPRRAIQIQIIKKNTKEKTISEKQSYIKKRAMFEIEELKKRIKFKNNIFGEFKYLFTNNNDGTLNYIANNTTFDKIYSNNINAWDQNNINEKYYHYTRNYLINHINTINNKDILEIGCGNGYSTNYLKLNIKSKNNFNGCDISKIAVKYAKEHYQDINFFEHNIKNKCMRKDKYDIIIFGDLLWYILTDLKQSINNALSMLKDNGQILFYNAFLENQKYGKDIIDGFDGLISFFNKNFPHKIIKFKHKSELINYKYLGLLII